MPLVIRVPGRSGARIAGRVPASVALTPTLLELLEIDYRLPEGRSLVPWLDEPTLADVEVVSETGFGDTHLRSVTDGDWKLILRTTLASEGEEGPAESLTLYDLTADPGEQVDVSADHPEVVARLEARLRARPIPEPEPPRAFSEELARELEALGYVN